MKFPRLTAALCGLLAIFTLGAGRKISDYTETLSITDAWIYEIAVPGVTNYKVTFGAMATNIIARVPVGGGSSVSPPISSVQFNSNGVMQGSAGFVFTNGLVGIGTALPVVALDIVKSQNAATSARVQNTSTGTGAAAALVAEVAGNVSTTFGTLGQNYVDNGAFVHSAGYLFNNSGGVSLIGSSGPLRFAAGGVDVDMIVNAAHNVGIGTTNPTAKLQVKAGTNQHFSVSTYLSYLAVSAKNDADNAFVPMYFYASPFALMSGNVGIGATNPVESLDVIGNISASGVLTGPITTLTPTIVGSAARIAFLTSQNTNVPTPLVVWFHGSGEDQNAAFTQIDQKRITDALIASGYIVASSTGGGISLWGNQASQDAYYGLYTNILANYSISKVIFVGASMGGLSSLNLIASGRVPVGAWYGINPVTSLSNAYTIFASSIEPAYGFSGAGGYAAATAGFDPTLASVALFSGVRMRMTSSYSDTSVPRIYNSDAFVTKVTNTVPEAVVVTATGAHGSASHLIPSDVLSFSSRAFLFDPSTNKITFLGNAIVPFGNVGIGTNAPSARLQVVADNSALKFVRFGTTNRPDLAWFDTNGSMGVASNLYVTGMVVTPAISVVDFFANTLTLTNALGSNVVRMGVQDLTNSVAVSPVDGDILSWDTSMKKWTNRVPATYASTTQMVAGAIGTLMVTNKVGIGVIPTNSTLEVLPTLSGTDYLRVNDTNGTRRFNVGVLSGFEASGTVWVGNITPSTVNYAMSGNGSALNFNGDIVTFNAAGGPRWQINALGHFVAGTDGTRNIGGNTAGRPLDVFLRGSVATYRSNLVASASIGIGVSGTNWTNSAVITALTNNVTVYIDASTATTVVTLSKNGQQIADSIENSMATVMLKPDEYITVVYSGTAPTARWEPF